MKLDSDIWVINLEFEGNQEQDLENEERYGDYEDQSCTPEMADESILDGEVGKRINQMMPIRVSFFYKCFCLVVIMSSKNL